MDHEQAWAEALATEHTHQRELLAAFRGELGAFARECAAALIALDSYVTGLAGVVDVMDAARTGLKHADLVLDIARRLSPNETDAELYEHLGGDGDLRPQLVDRARSVLRATPRRTDRELLKAVVDAAGVRSRIEQIVGPAPLVALNALRPLARRLPGLATIDPKENETARIDLAQALEQTSQLASVEGEGVVADAAALVSSLHTTVQHVQGAARAVGEGRLEQVVAEARALLQGDLDTLRAVLPEAPADWRASRQVELDALTAEVHEKLERIERTRRALAAFLPHLQTIVRTLSTLERFQAVEGRFDGRLRAGAEAARAFLLLGVGSIWSTAVPTAASAPAAPARRSVDKRLLVGAALVVLLIGVGVALAVGGGSKKKAAAVVLPTTTNKVSVSVAAPVATPKAPKVSPVQATFVEAQRATFYAVNVAAPGQTVTYAWRLTPPKDNPTCTKFAPVPGSPNKAVWHHADTDSCAHTGFQHNGTVTVVVTTPAWRCAATFFGTLTKSGPPAQRCTRA
jgi:hypothetical protein